MSFSRRQLLGSSGLVGAALAGIGGGNLAWSKNDKPPRGNSGGRGRYQTIEVDLAVLGYTNADNPGGAINPDFATGLDTRGIIQYYEGVLYPAGSIPELPEGQPDNAGSEDSITWILPIPPSVENGEHQQTPEDCVDNSGEPAQFNEAVGGPVQATGSFLNQANIIINRPCRGNPHFISEHTFYMSAVLGEGQNVDAPNLNTSPLDMLLSKGPENGSPPGDDMVRAVTGGTGKYRFAQGQVTQRRLGRNNTRIRGLGRPGFEPFSPNYRFTFELRLW